LKFHPEIQEERDNAADKIEDDIAIDEIFKDRIKNKTLEILQTVKS
jgi:hypothetical protein